MLAGTIVASNYLEMAKLLARSFLDQHADGSFSILLVDDLDVGVPADDGAAIEIVRLGDLAIDAADLDRMRTIYDVMELSTAVKPAFLARLLERGDLACYIDPDVFVYRSFTDLVTVARDVGVVLTPHVLTPIPRDGRAPTERQIMQSGVFNLGFIAVGRSARPMLDWWQERLLLDAVSDVEANLFTDQRWVDWVPALFEHAVCRDPGMNIAWWNIHERELERRGAELLANGSPVRFVHFSGYSPADPHTFSKHQVPTPRTEHDGVIRELAEEYGAALLASGHAERIGVPYQWATTDDGVRLTPTVRSTVRRAILGGARTRSETETIDDTVPSAFGPTAARFRAWLTEPVAGDGEVSFSRAEVGLWDSRADLRIAFADRDGVHAAPYRNWLDHDPSVAEALPGLVPDRVDAAGASAGRSVRPRRPVTHVGRVTRRLVRPVVARVRSLAR